LEKIYLIIIGKSANKNGFFRRDIKNDEKKIIFHIVDICRIETVKIIHSMGKIKRRNDKN
jgi:hypothetical protein